MRTRTIYYNLTASIFVRDVYWMYGNKLIRNASNYGDDQTAQMWVAPDDPSL